MVASTTSAAVGPLPLEEDAALTALVDQALRTRPEVAQARAQLAAERAKVPQAGAWQEPALTLGLQNDGFRSLQLGVMPTSYLWVGASQTFPWPSRPGQRAQVARAAVASAEADVERAERSVRGEVEGAYLALLLAREELELAGRLDQLWVQAVELARGRYEAGEASQGELLRAQLERSRLARRRLQQEAEERLRLVALNRLAGRPLEAPLETSGRLSGLADPPPIVAGPDRTSAGERSPELARARSLGRLAEERLNLSRAEWFPDVTLSAAFMLRGLTLEPMWQASLGVNLPVLGTWRQAPAVAQAEAEARAAAAGLAATEQLLQQRELERAAVLDGLRAALRLYRGGLLTQSDTAVQAALAQYRSGEASFTTVLEALAGALSDQEGFLTSLAAAHRLAIAERASSLEPVDPSGGGGALMEARPGGMTGSARPPSPAASPSAPTSTPRGGM